MKNFTLLALFLFSLQFVAAQPTTDGLVLWLPFNGNANDESNSNHSASVYGPELVPDRHGNSEAAYRFDGVDDYMLIPDHTDLRLSQTSFTISLWANIDAFDEWTHAFLCKRYGPGNLGYMFQIIGANHPANLETGSANMVVSGGTDPYIGATNLLNTNEWHHLVYCFDHTTNLAQFFIDNLPDVQASMPPPSGEIAEDLYIGKDIYTGYFLLNGALDDIRIYRKKLDRAEINELFNEGLNPTTELAKNINISIQPNLTSDFINVFAESIEIQSFAIHDISGRILQKAEFSNKIDCRQLPSGSYTISFFSKQDKFIKSEKFIKS
ncbi:MAG: T9SS type A sorting domain-containing protein [Saprospiraceae bacterium]|nr:T9SS type A sorting domain-containing protein [Saprospiraceae bacterium]